MERIADMMDVFPIYGYERKSLISKEKGCLTIPLKLELPEVFTLDQRDYNTLNGLFFNIIDISPYSSFEIAAVTFLYIFSAI